MQTRDEIAADSFDSEMTISDHLLGIPCCGNQAQGAESDGHGYTDGLEVDSAPRAKRAVSKSKSLQVPLEKWLKEVDSGKGKWTATKTFRSDGKTYDKVSILIF